MKNKVNTTFKRVLEITLLSLLVLIIGLFIYDYFRIKPNNVQFTNITSNSVTVSWDTKAKTSATAIYKKGNSKFPFSILSFRKQEFFDTRDITEAELEATQESIQNQDGSEVTMNDIVTDVSVTNRGKYYTHHIEITGLDPETEYSFMVGDSILFRSVKDVNNKTVAKTYAVPESILTPIPAYGSVRDAKGYGDLPLENLPIVNDGIVYLYYFDKVTGESSNIFSSPLNEVGNWYMDVANAIDRQGNIFKKTYKGDEEGLYINLSLNLGPSGLWERQDVSGIISPADTFVINIPNEVVSEDVSLNQNSFRYFILDKLYAKETEGGCRDDSDCPSGYSCDNEICVKNIVSTPNDYDCNTDSQCGDGYECNDNHECEKKVEPADKNECYKDSDCDGENCNISANPNVCQTKEDEEEEQNTAKPYKVGGPIFLGWCGPCRYKMSDGSWSKSKQEYCPENKLEARNCANATNQKKAQENLECDNGEKVNSSVASFYNGVCKICIAKLDDKGTTYYATYKTSEYHNPNNGCSLYPNTVPTCGADNGKTFEKIGQLLYKCDIGEVVNFKNVTKSYVTWKCELFEKKSELCSATIGVASTDKETCLDKNKDKEINKITYGDKCIDSDGCNCPTTTNETKIINCGAICPTKSDNKRSIIYDNSTCYDSDNCYCAIGRSLREIDYNISCTDNVKPNLSLSGGLCNDFDGCICDAKGRDISKGEYCNSTGSYVNPSNSDYCGIKGERAIDKCDSESCYSCINGKWEFVKDENNSNARFCKEKIKGNDIGCYSMFENVFCNDISKNITYMCHNNKWEVYKDDDKIIAFERTPVSAGNECMTQLCYCESGIDIGKPIVNGQFCKEVATTGIGSCDGAEDEGKVCTRQGWTCQGSEKSGYVCTSKIEASSSIEGGEECQTRACECTSGFDKGKTILKNQFCKEVATTGIGSCDGAEDEGKVCTRQGWTCQGSEKSGYVCTSKIKTSSSIEGGERCQTRACECTSGFDKGKTISKNQFCKEVATTGIDSCDGAKDVGKVCTRQGWTCQGSEKSGYVCASKIKNSMNIFNNQNLLSMLNLTTKIFAEKSEESRTYIIDQQTGLISNLESGTYSFEIYGETYFFDISEESLKANNGNLLIFIDKNDNGEYDKDTDIKVSTLGSQIEITTIQKNYTYSLKEGFNFVSFPFVVAYDEYRTAASLLKQLNSVYGDIIYSISKFDGSWKVVGQNLELYDNNDFQLLPGQGYVIKAKEDINIVIPGKPIKYESSEETAPIYLSQGWNLIGIYGTNVKSYTAKSMLQDINNFNNIDFTANNVTKWESDTQRYEGYQLNITDGVEKEYGFDYPIDILKSYFVRVENGTGNWQPELESK